MRAILHVQRRLCHRSILSAMLYMQLVSFESDEYHVRISKSLKEEDLISVGFEYVTGLDGAEVYRESKQSKPTEAGSKP